MAHEVAAQLGVGLTTLQRWRRQLQAEEMAPIAEKAVCATCLTD